MDGRQIKSINNLLLVASFSLTIGITLMIPKPEPESEEKPTETTATEQTEKVLEIKRPKRTPNPYILKETELRNSWQSVEITYQTIETEYLGRYFVTAYSDEETNSRATASGVEVHYSEDNFEPTTCAIDRNFHRFGELFMIDGHVYVAEDTGAFRGLWIDCFVETMEEVWLWNTGYKSVYSVSYEIHQIKSSERKKINESYNYYLHFGIGSDRVPFRNNGGNLLRSEPIGTA